MGSFFVEEIRVFSYIKMMENLQKTKMIDFEKTFCDFEHKRDVSLKDFSTMKVGGIGKIIVYPKNVKEIKKIREKCEKNGLKMLILGNGSNVLFSDDGFDGVIVKLKNFDQFRVIKKYKEIKNVKKNQFKSKFYFQKFVKNRRKKEKNYEKIKKISEKMQKKRKKMAKNQILIEIGAGMNLFSLNVKLKNFGASGLEWSYGIPATVGGFVRMNGGCFGHEISELVRSVQVLENGKVKWLKRKDLKFEYRKTNLEKCIILAVKMRFFAKKSEKIEKSMKNFYELKKKLQPCDVPSLGSVFKRQGNISASKIIDDLGLKGFSIGGAQVSPKHAGFVVNFDNATSEDVKELVGFLTKELSRQGFAFEKEIIYV